MNLLQNPEFPVPDDLRLFWQEIEVEALDEANLQFRLPEAFAPFLDYLDFGILPAHLLGNLSPAEIVDAPFNLQPVGTGPFRFEQLIISDNQIMGVVLRKNKDFYGKGAFLDQVEFKYYQDSQMAWEAYTEGEIQGIDQISSDILPEALNDPGMNLYTSRLPQMALVLVNLDNPEVPYEPWKNRKGW